jgi:hypothetical protein
VKYSKNSWMGDDDLPTVPASKAPDVTRPVAPAALPDSAEETRRRMATTTPILVKPARPFAAVLADFKAGRLPPVAPPASDHVREPAQKVAPPPRGPRCVPQWPEGGAP